ncbi:MAG: carboxymuconolactone decarboxylase family protein [Alphaproteobacteria bacterium]
MSERIARADLYKLQPAIVRNLRALGQAVEDSGLEKTIIELVKMRASQINGCAFCLHMHAADARKLGERQDRLDVLDAWREVDWFDARERAALLWTEALTSLTDSHAPDEVYAEAKAPFTDAEFANLTAAIVTINAWNRIAVGMRFRIDRE